MEALLFTDIESSTRLWEEHPDAMAKALERHDAIMLDNIKAEGGRLLKTTGDGAIAVFDSVPAAVGTASSAQLALLAEPWKATLIRVRMGFMPEKRRAETRTISAGDVPRAQPHRLTDSVVLSV